MNTILASCSSCGDIELMSDDITIHTWAIDGPGDYTFRCADCGLNNVVAADARTLDLLIAAGAQHEIWQPRFPVREVDHRIET